jgi:diguanylate cyclase (GGDEF)-like protein
MPRCDGFTVCRELRKDPLFAHLPIIILSASGSRDSRIEGLDLGVDDFITKSVDIRELLARIRMILKRTRQGLDANPLTRLPGNLSIESRIEDALAKGQPMAVLYVDLDQFKAYNDCYGYEAGDHVLRSLADILIKASRAHPGPPDFVGHIGGDDFIILCDPSRMEETAQRVITEFDAAAPGFYSESDRQRGRIVSTDRQGNVKEFPLLSVSIGICHNAGRKLESLAQLLTALPSTRRGLNRHDMIALRTVSSKFLSVCTKSRRSTAPDGAMWIRTTSVPSHPWICARCG